MPDVIAPGLDVLFVGINPGLLSARAGHHFANPSNAFWRLLHESGFTPRRMAPHEDYQLPRFRLGITNIVARETAGASELTRDELSLGAASLGRRIRRFKPRAVVFVGVTVWAPFARRFGLATAAPSKIGEQPESFAGARLFVLPNPSGRNAHFTRAQMLRLYRQAARALRSEVLAEADAHG